MKWNSRTATDKRSRRAPRAAPSFGRAFPAMGEELDSTNVTRPIHTSARWIPRQCVRTCVHVLKHLHHTCIVWGVLWSRAVWIQYLVTDTNTWWTDTHVIHCISWSHLTYTNAKKCARLWVRMCCPRPSGPTARTRERTSESMKQQGMFSTGNGVMTSGFGRNNALFHWGRLLLKEDMGRNKRREMASLIHWCVSTCSADAECPT